MPLSESTFKSNDVEVIKKHTLYRGFFHMLKVTLKHRLFAGGWSGDIERELFKRGNASAALLYDPKSDCVGLIEQFRVGALESPKGPWCLEVVAGMVEEGETPEEVITREIAEEAGILNCELLPITTYLSSPGGSDEHIHLYCAVCDLSDAGGIFGLKEENEDIFLRVFAVQDIFPVMLNSRMNNAATLLGLQWLQLNHQRLKGMS